MLFLGKKLLSALLLPPGILIVLLAISAGVFLRRRMVGAALCNAFLALLLYLLSIAPTADLLGRGLETGLTPPGRASGDVIVVLGGGIDSRVNDFGQQGAPGPDALERTVLAARLQQRLNVPVILSGGSLDPGQPSEAAVLRRLLVDLKIPENQLILEGGSRDTRENARYCREIIHSRQFRKPLLVTSSYHMRRSVMAFEQAGIQVTPVPAGLKAGPRPPYTLLSFLPNTGALNSAYQALHEYLGLLFYRITTILGPKSP